MSGKRAAPQGGNRKKRNKSYHCAKEASGSKGKNAFNLQPGMKGILVACTRSKESRAVKEAMDILTEYANILYPEQEKETVEDEDIEASIAREVAEMKGPKDKKMFANITTGTDCLTFIRANDPVEPTKLIHHMLTDLNEKQLKKTRFISRYIPIEKTCPSNMPDIESTGKALFENYFGQKDDQGNLLTKKFAIVCRVRNCNKLGSRDVINALAAVVPAGHSVDLINPDYTVLVEICQTVCMMSVVQDFHKLKKYNIESLLGVNDSKKEAVESNEPVEVNKAVESNEPVEANKAVESNK